MSKNKLVVEDLALIILLIACPFIVSWRVPPRIEAGAYGLMFFYSGFYLFLTRRRFVAALLSQEQRKRGQLSKWFGVAQAVKDESLRIFAGTLMRFLGISFILGGSLMLFTFVTGLDWPLHYR